MSGSRQLKDITNLSVDFLTCAALAAIQVSVFWENWPMLATMSFLGAIGTVFFVLWFSSRCFTQDRFHHAILWFGCSLGTLPMGLALLRMVDPTLKSAAPKSATLASAMAPLIFAPLFLGIIPYGVTTWIGEKTTYVALLGMVLVYLAVIALLWRQLGGLQLVEGRHLWITREDG